jgi:AcrR family transcriptional regulator
VSAAPSRLRDADRSREAILGAAEALFAERGFERASLSEIGASAGLSRGTPAYFYGSKERLYVAVLERVVADRQEATARAFAPVRDWREGDDALRAALDDATEGELRFLLGRPASLKLLVREELSDGARLREVPRTSTAMRDAFAALRERGLDFDVDDAVLLFVSLTFSALALQPTLLAALGRDVSDPATRRRHVALAVDQLLALLTAARASSPRARRR